MTDRQDVDTRMRVLQAKLRTLAREHADASAHVDDYSRRRYLSPGEQVEMRTLQRLKLLKKDTMVTVERELVSLESGPVSKPPT